MSIMDRYLFRHFLQTYFIVFFVLVSLYIVIDLFSNMDEFIKPDQSGQHPPMAVYVQRIAKYYFLHGFEYFWRLSPVITQVSAMSTLASLHRYNEIVALLAAGIPTRRALTPILMGVILMIGLSVANRELVLPANSDFLQRSHDDVDGKNKLPTSFRFDKDGMVASSQEADRDAQRLDAVNLLFEDNQEIKSASATFEKDAETGRPGLRLEGVTTADVHTNEKIKALGDRQYFVFTELTMDRMIRQNNWTLYASTNDLLRELDLDQSSNPGELRALIHNRLMQPVSNLLLVFLGIPFVLTWNQRNIFRSLFIAMLLSGAFFVLDGVSTYIAQFAYIDSMFAAWLPVFLFGPIAMALSHRIGT
jgi:lipopolysaccharide export system permease protein